jgi:hypothetical protein
MTFDELLNQDATGNLRDLYYVATKQRKNPDYCAMLEWEGTDFTPARGVIALKHLVSRNIPANLMQYRDYILDNFHRDMTPCQHDGECQYNRPVPPPSKDSNVHSFSRGERIVNGKILSPPPFVGLISALEALAEGSEPEPMPGLVPETKSHVMTWTYKPPKDEADPVYIVLSEHEARRLADELEYLPRFKRGDIGARYLKESIYVCGPGQRDLILSDSIDKDSITGYLSYKPVVLTFGDSELEDKLAAVCVSVGVVLPIEKKLTTAIRRSLAQRPEVEKLSGEELDLLQSKERWWPPIETFRAQFKATVAEASTTVADMPAEVLDGWLGDICRTRMKDFPIAYAWPALLAAASVLVPKCGTRTNLYVALIGPPGSGKSSAFEYAFKLLSLDKPLLQRLKSGSAEGLMKFVGNVEGAPRLFFPGELAHLLKKAAIDGSTFCETLSDLYYTDAQESTVSEQKKIEFNARLSIAGGLPEESFGDLFGAASTQGLYQRFIFAECPTGFQYSFEELDQVESVIPPQNFTDEEDTMSIVPGRAVGVVIDPSVKTERERWAKDYGIDQRIAGHAIRAAVIAASFDSRPVLRGDDLGPALVLAQYLTRIRKVMEPNPGLNTGGIIHHKIMNYLKKHAPNGDRVVERTMARNARLYDHGADAAERVLDSLAKAGEIVRERNGRQRVCRFNTDRI